MRKRVNIDSRLLPDEIRELKIYDGRPAFLFVDLEGHLPLVRINKNGERSKLIAKSIKNLWKLRKINVLLKI